MKSKNNIKWNSLCKRKPTSKLDEYKWMRRTNLTACCCFSTSLQTYKHDYILFSLAWIPLFNTRINELFTGGQKKMFTLLWLWFNVHYSKELGSLITFDPLTVTGRQTNSPCAFKRDGYKMCKVMKCTCKAVVLHFTISSPSSLRFSLVPTKSFWKALLLKNKNPNKQTEQTSRKKQQINKH